MQQQETNISYTYKPDFSTPFWGYYYKVQTDSSQTNPENFALQSRFNNTVFGGPTQGEQQSIGFGMINLFEMKYKAMMFKAQAVNWGVKAATAKYQAASIKLG